MRRLSISALILLAAAFPARADLAADYTTLLRTLPLDLSAGTEDQYLAGEARIRSLAGRWVALSILAGDRPEAPDPAIIAKACGKHNMDIVPTGSMSLTIATGNDGGRTASLLNYVGGVEYVAVTDEQSARLRLFGDKADSMPPNTAFTVLTQPILRGRVILLPAGQNLLILIDERRPPVIWGRCGG